MFFFMTWWTDYFTIQVVRGALGKCERKKKVFVEAQTLLKCESILVRHVLHKCSVRVTRGQMGSVVKHMLHVHISNPVST